MTVQQATAEVFLTAFKALSRQEQESILSRIARDRKFRRLLEDISDLLIIEEGGISLPGHFETISRIVNRGSERGLECEANGSYGKDY